MQHKQLLTTLLASLLSILTDLAQIIPVGSGSYTTSFPGTDAAGRNGFPSGSPQLSGNAAGKPVPTNDWWSKLVKENHADNLFNYPFTMKTVNDGLVVSYIPRGVIDDQLPVVVGVSGLSANRTTVSDHSDWAITMNWNDGTRFFETSSGVGMPFFYPNPVIDQLHLQLEEGGGRLRVYTLAGTLVIDQAVDATALVPMAQLPSGIYYLEVKSERNTSYRARFIKH